MSLLTAYLKACNPAQPQGAADWLWDHVAPSWGVQQAGNKLKDLNARHSDWRLDIYWSKLGLPRVRTTHQASDVTPHE